jgi:hypothetical protein
MIIKARDASLELKLFRSLNFRVKLTEKEKEKDYLLISKRVLKVDKNGTNA